MFKSALQLEAMKEPNEWALTSDLIWRTDTVWAPSGEIEACGVRLVVPKYYITDLASIPRILRNLLNVNGKSRRAAVLHDFLYACATSKVHYRPRSRGNADAIFYKALRSEGVGRVAATAYWLGVRAGGWITWRKRLRTGLRATDWLR